MNGSNVLEVEQLTVNYEKTSVLWDINFSIPGGKLVGIIGPNGAGKSSLLKALAGILKPTAGKIRMHQQLAYVPQRASVDWEFPITALELVLMGSYGRLGFLKWATKKEKAKAREILALVEMLPFEGRQIGQLSGGQQQRLFVARALMQEADVYLMDEPFSGIDAATEKSLISLFDELRKKGKTLLIVHHDLSTAETYFDWTILLNTCLIASGPTKDVFSKDNLMRTYGRNPTLLDEAAALSQEKTTGRK